MVCVVFRDFQNYETTWEYKTFTLTLQPDLCPEILKWKY